MPCSKCNPIEPSRTTTNLSLTHPHPTSQPLTHIIGPEVISVLREVPVLGRLLTSLYDCDYRGFMHALVDITPDLTRDRCVR